MIEFLKQLKPPRDKALHIATATISGVAIRLITNAMWAAPAVGLAIGVIKEYMDYKSNQDAVFAGFAPRHSVEGLDAICTSYGAVVGAAFMDIVLMLMKR